MVAEGADMDMVHNKESVPCNPAQTCAQEVAGRYTNMAAYTLEGVAQAPVSRTTLWMAEVRTKMRT